MKISAITGGGANGGSEKAALVDSGMNTPDARQIAEGLTDLPLILINTHADPGKAGHH